LICEALFSQLSGVAMASEPEHAGKLGTGLPRDAERERLAAALRENLRRRKAQERGRRTAEDQRKSPD
jgi:hypothetical protein